MRFSIITVAHDFHERLFYNIFQENLYQHHKSNNEQNKSWEVAICPCLEAMKKSLVAIVEK